MSWPEDDVDFEDCGPPEERGGDALSAAEIIAAARAVRESSPSVYARPVDLQPFGKRKKIPCRGRDERDAKAKKPDPAPQAQPEIVAQLRELNARQDKLAEATLKSLERISRRMDRVEAQPVSVFAVAPWQKTCLFIFTLGMLGFTALFVMSCVMHYNGWVR